MITYKDDNITLIYHKDSDLINEINLLKNKIIQNEIKLPDNKKNQLYSYFKYKIRNTNLKELNYVNTESIIIDNCKLFFKHFKSKNSNGNLFIINPGIGSFSTDDINMTSSYYFIKYLLQSDYDVIILFREYILNGVFYYEPFNFSNYLNYFIKYLIKSKFYIINQIYIIGISAGCNTLLHYISKLDDYEYKKKIKKCFVISCAPYIKDNIINLSLVNNKLLCSSIVYKLKKINCIYKKILSYNIFDLVGNIGIINNDMHTLDEYYNSLELDQIQINNFDIPVIFLNSYDDDIANTTFLNKFIDEFSINKNFNFIITNTGWHGTFYNEDNKFIYDIIKTFID